MRLVIIFIIIVFTSCKHDLKNQVFIEEADSIYVENYENGNKRIVADVDKGMFQGYYESYYPNGNIESVGVNMKNRKFGIWKFFDENEKMTRMARFMNDTLQFEYDKEDFLGKKEKLLNSTIMIPNSWSEVDHSSEPKILLELNKECTNASSICPNLIVTNENSNGVLFNDYIEKNLAIPEDNNTFIKVDEKSFKVNGLNAHRVQYKTVIKGIDIAGAITFIEKNNGEIFIFFVRTENSPNNKDYLKYRLMFNDIVNSFR